MPSRLKAGQQPVSSEFKSPALSDHALQQFYDSPSKCMILRTGGSTMHGAIGSKSSMCRA